MIRFSRLPPKPTSACISGQLAGFTLPEVLVSAVILLISVVGSIVAFNLIVQSVRGTGLRASQNRAIDRDIARISQLSEDYTACELGTGSIPEGTGCTDVIPGQSFYYFPDPTDEDEITAFFSACRATTEAGHITKGFMNEIDELPSPDDDNVERLDARRVDSSDFSNHLVEVEWRDSTRSDNRAVRIIQISPLISAWCP